MPRFHAPVSGRVLVDRHDVRDLTLESLGSHIGVLFHASITDNLPYARPDATDDQLVAAATAAHLHRSPRCTHAELLAVGGLYAELYRRQFLAQEPARAGVS